MERHPFGKVPVLDHDGMRILETSAIARYLNDVFPNKSLVPSTPKDRARMDMIIGMIDSYGYGALLGGVVAYHLFPDFVGGKNDALRKDGLENGRKMIDFAMKTKGSSPFIAGELSLCRSAILGANCLLCLTDSRQGGAFRYRRLCGMVVKDASLAKLQRYTAETCLINTAKIWRFEFTLLAPSLERHRPTRARAQISKRRERGREAYFNSRETRYETRGGMYFFTMSAYFFALVTSDSVNSCPNRILVASPFDERLSRRTARPVQQVDAFATETCAPRSSLRRAQAVFRAWWDRA